MIVIDDGTLRVLRLELGPWATNAYVVICLKTGDSLLIDAPARSQRIFDSLKRTTPRYILLTHGHVDHTGALAAVKEQFKVPIAAHSADARSLPVKPQMLLEDGDTIEVGKLSLRVLHTPGHTPGSLGFLLENILFSGDTLFPGGPGHTDSPDDFKQIVSSITSRLFVLPDQTQVYPGHGPSTILKKEKEEFALFSTRVHPETLYGDVLWLS